jgi:hypothetical protein
VPRETDVVDDRRLQRDVTAGSVVVGAADEIARPSPHRQHRRA